GAIAHDLPPHRVAVVVERERYCGEKSPAVALDPGAPKRSQDGGRLGSHEKLERGGAQSRELRFARRLLPRGVARRLEERERPPQAPLRRRGQEPGRGLGDSARFDERRGDEVGRQRAEPHVEAAGGDRREERPDPPRAKDQYPARLRLLEDFQEGVGRGACDRLGALHNEDLGASLPLSRQGEELLGPRQIIHREDRGTGEDRNEVGLARHPREDGGPGLRACLLGLPLRPSLGPEGRQRQEKLKVGMAKLADAPAGGARTAGAAVGERSLAKQGLGEKEGCLRLPDPGRAVEEVGVSDVPRFKGGAEKRERFVLAAQGTFGHGEYGSTEPLERIQCLPPFADLEVERRTYGGAGVAYPADDLSGGHLLGDGDADLGGVGVKRVETTAVVDDNTLAVALEPDDVVDPPSGHSGDRGPERRRDVDAAIEGSRVEPGVGLVPERPRDPPVHRPREAAPVPPEVA